MNFCRRCGSTLLQKEGHIFQCIGDPSHTIYGNATPAVGIFIIDNDHNVTLSVRGIEPRKGMLDAFGGFVDGLELAEDAVERELKEELGLARGQYSEPVFLCSGEGTYPYEGEILPVLSLFFYIILDSNVEIFPQDDVAGVQTSPLEDVPLERLHDIDIVRGVKALQQRFSL